jgi:hypothetical protein
MKIVFKERVIVRPRNNYCRKLTANGYTDHEHPWIYVTEWPICPVKGCYWNQQQTETNWQLSASKRKIHLGEFPILVVIIRRCRFTFKIQLCVKITPGRLENSCVPCGKKLCLNLQDSLKKSLGLCDKWQTYVLGSGTVANLVKYCDLVCVDLLQKKRHYLAM